ncbi:MAG: carbon storage regulator [Planctomycetaceae bacterium]
MMLVLTRKSGEEIVIGENITVRIVQCGNGRASLAVDAPRDVSILRAELSDQQLADSIGHPIAAVARR